MRTFVVVNVVPEMGFRQTTALLTAALVRRSEPVLISAVEDLWVEGNRDKNRFLVDARPVPFDGVCDSHAIEAFVQSEPAAETMELEKGDRILIRTNPGRDLERQSLHDTFLQICRSAMAHGISVLNDPSHLPFFASKAALAQLDPGDRPPMIVSHDPGAIIQFVRRQSGDCVVKPLAGSRGQNVIRVSSSDRDLEFKIESLLPKRGLIAQPFIHADPPGDHRVIVWEGDLLAASGQVAGIDRRPADLDFRGNLHAGGAAHPLTLTPAAERAARAAAKLLQNHGIRLAGVDLVGDQIVEFNVFSTGGLFDAIRFAGVDFADFLAGRILGS